MTKRTLEDAIALNDGALGSMLKGDCSGYVGLLTERDDVSWGNPFGPYSVGRKAVEATLAAAAARMPGGVALGPETVARYEADGLAVMVQNEKGEGPDGPFALRVTSVFRAEDGDWKLVHRHADPITTPR